jgi:hypothetical protein
MPVSQKNKKQKRKKKLPSSFLYDNSIAPLGKFRM